MRDIIDFDDWKLDAFPPIDDESFCKSPEELDSGFDLEKFYKGNSRIPPPLREDGTLDLPEHSDHDDDDFLEEFSFTF